MYRKFTITPGMCGFKVEMGCSELYFGHVSALKAAINSYLDLHKKHF